MKNKELQDWKSELQDDFAKLTAEMRTTPLPWTNEQIQRFYVLGVCLCTSADLLCLSAGEKTGFLTLLQEKMQ